MLHTTYIHTHLAIYISLFHVSIYLPFISSTQVSILYHNHALVAYKAIYLQSFKGYPICFDGACNWDMHTPNHNHLSFLYKYLYTSYLLYASKYLFLSFILRISIDHYPYSTQVSISIPFSYLHLSPIERKYLSLSYNDLYVTPPISNLTYI